MLLAAQLKCHCTVCAQIGMHPDASQGPLGMSHMVTLQIHCEAADKAGMHIVYPGLRPMFRGHVESNAMQSARLRRTGVPKQAAKAPQTDAVAASSPASSISAEDMGPIDPPEVVPAPVPQIAVAAFMRRIHAKQKATASTGGMLLPKNGAHSPQDSPWESEALADKPRDNRSAEGDTRPGSVPAAAVKKDSGIAQKTAEQQHNQSHQLRTESENGADRKNVNSNGKESDYDQNKARVQRGLHVSAKPRARKRGREGGTDSNGRGMPPGSEAAAADAERARPATASVIWQPSDSVGVWGGDRGHKFPLRAMHVAVLCQWRIGSAVDDGQVHVHWDSPSSDSAVAAAWALHRLAYVHWCHWKFAVPPHRAYLAVTPGSLFNLPRVAHWPIHCALAARACRLAQQVLA